MIELKERMLEEINNYITATNDYELENFISEEILSFMDTTKKELIWYPTKKNENNYITDISIQNA